ncbi:MAG TPA: nuclear transport factor 2 family protein [Gemmatimonadaceae bacterium]|nr:nuclear transport factor 2 family protein [Gemmatimonadaceae bacterium]
MGRYPRPATVVRQFVERINAHDVAGIVDLLAPEHRFIDSLGTVFEGRDSLRAGWTGYLRMVPDYVIEIERLIDDGEAVFLIGHARGTYTHDGTMRPENAWRTPAAWMALVKRGQLTEWRVFADNEPIRQRMRSRLEAAGGWTDR